MAQKTKGKLDSIVSARAALEEQPAAHQPEAGDNADLDNGRIVSAGVGVKEGELAAFEALAARHDVTKNAIMRIALRYFLVKVRAGEVNPEDYLEEPEKPKKRTRLPK